MGVRHGGWGTARHARVNECGHPDARHYANGLCRQCYRNTPDFVAKRHAYYLANKPKFMAHCKKRRANGRLASKLYGLNPATYRRMVEMQCGLCAICQRQAGKKGLGVDHCHATGKVRALLCTNCNMALGGFRDDPALMRRAAGYIEQWL